MAKTYFFLFLLCCSSTLSAMEWSHVVFAMQRARSPYASDEELLEASKQNTEAINSRTQPPSAPIPTCPTDIQALELWPRARSVSPAPEPDYLETRASLTKNLKDALDPYWGLDTKGLAALSLADFEDPSGQDLTLLLHVLLYENGVGPDQRKEIVTVLPDYVDNCPDYYAKIRRIEDALDPQYYWETPDMRAQALLAKLAIKRAKISILK